MRITVLVMLPSSKILFFQILFDRMTGNLNIMQELAELEQRRSEVKCGEFIFSLSKSVLVGDD